ncbi:MAG: hypothetical protein O2877_00020 [bacterium]|nr:hypothetical protein [bacterium]
MNHKNRVMITVVVLTVVTVIWYFVLDARGKVNADVCAMVDCVPLSEWSWPLLYGSGCCGPTTTFRVFGFQLLQLLAPGVILALIVGFITRKR